MAYIIGIAGGTASGKTTLAENLCNDFKGKITLISSDNFFKPFKDLPLDNEGFKNFDSLDSFDTSLLVECLKSLKEGKEVLIPKHSYVLHDREKDYIKVTPNNVIIIEGMVLLAIKEIQKYLDFKIYVDTDDDIRIVRRLLREYDNKRDDYIELCKRYLRSIKPFHNNVINPSKIKANLIINGNTIDIKEYNMIIQVIKKNL